MRNFILGMRSSKPWGVRRPRARPDICAAAGMVGRQTVGQGSRRFASKRRVAPHVVVRPKIDKFLDERAGRIRNFEAKTAEIGAVGRNTV